MVPRDPSSCRGWITFRVGPHFSGPSARRELLRHRAGCAQRSLPVPCTLQRCPILGGSEGRFRPRRDVPAATLLPCARPNGSEGNGIGNARGIPPRGVGRRYLFGCEGVRTSSRGRTSRGSVTSAPHLWRASSARHVRSAWSWITCWTRLKLALRVKYSTWVLGCVKDGINPHPSPLPEGEGAEWRSGWLDGHGTYVLGLGVGWRVRWRTRPYGV